MEAQRDELLASALECYRAALAVMAANGAKACPSLGAGLQENLLAIRDRVTSTAAPGVLTETRQEVDAELDDWGKSAAAYYKRKAGEIKEIMLVMAQAAEAVAQRDQHYKAQVGEVTTRLQAIGDLEDLTRIRQMLGESAAEIRSCVERMVKEGQESVAKLQTELASYEERLLEAERQSALDPLTGLANKQSLERELQARLPRGQMFCVVLIDLNGFKDVNDRHGHLAGDALLKQFAQELRAQFRVDDAVGRWGGDEFMVLLDCSVKEALMRIDRVRKWAFGSYTVDAAGKKVKIAVSGSIGIAPWQPGKTAEQLFQDADAAMYAEKSLAMPGKA